MQKRLLGKTGYQVSAVVYGGIISMNEDQATSDRYVSWAIDQGVNYFDVAPTYGDAEEKLGNSLKPYRKNVYLACKTTERMRTEAEKELQQSMKLLHTDYFDNFQLHSMTKPEDVEKAFGPGGIMELLIPLKEKGVIRKLGFSAHSETAALKCLDLYDFDTVLFPMNYMLDMNEGIGKELAQEANIAAGQALCNVTFTPLDIIEEVLDANPSIEGAVPTIIYGSPVTRARILLMSFIVPEPTATIKSQLLSKFIAACPTANSSGSRKSCG
jgi:predicted aldo/keto reductase-like oxidoreductase